MIVIPMAGLSSRFTKAGFDRPKYMLDLHGRPVFDYALASFRHLFTDQAFLIICRDVQETPDFVRHRCHQLGIRKVQVVVLNAPTSGQGETVLLGLDQVKASDDEPVTIFNIDSFRAGFRYPQDNPRAASFLEVFKENGDNWSFVVPVSDEAGGKEYRVARVVEKERVSDLCCNGLYHFASAGDYRIAYKAEQQAPTQTLTESYIAPIYNQLIHRGDDVRYSEVPNEDLVFCGMPEEYCVAQGSSDFVEKFFPVE